MLSRILKKSNRTWPVERILVIQTAFVGDVVLTTPFLAALREEYPQAKISVLVTPAGFEILTPNPWNIDLLIYDKRKQDSGLVALYQLVCKLRKKKFDVVFCLHRSFRSGLISFLSWAPLRIGFKEAAGAWAYQKKVSRKTQAYEAEKNLALLQAFIGAQKQYSPYPKLFFHKTDEEAAMHSLAQIAHRPFVAISPSSVWATKRWPAERFGQLAAKLWQEQHLPVVILSGKEQSDRQVSDELLVSLKILAPDAQVLDLTGKTSLGMLKAVIAKAKFIIANDSAPLHIGIAMNVPVVGIFGSTTKELGFFPLAPQGKAVVAEITLACRPCGVHGHKRCPLQHFRCMLDLPVSRVAEVAKVFL